MHEDICREYGVNREQAGALEIEKSIALRAGAGSGKTRVLTRRFLRLLVDVPDIEIDQIVAITFTRKAAAEMKERVRNEISLRIDKTADAEKNRWKKLRMELTSANIDTIHGFCGKILKDNFFTAGLDPSFSVMEETDAGTKLVELAQGVIDDYVNDEGNMEIIDSIISVYSTSLFSSGALQNGLIGLYKSVREKGADIEEIEQIMDDREDDDCTPGELERMALSALKMLDEKYREFKDRENLLDFNDLEILTDRLLEDEAVRERYFNRYRYFLIDEFQDVNPIQKRIIYKLVLKGDVVPQGRLFIVGDQKQSIYGFRGTDYRIFEETCSIIKESGGEVKKLKSCYRSTGSIIDTVNSVFDKLIEPYEDLSIPDTGCEKGRNVELITWRDDDITDEAKKRWEEVKKLLPDDSKGDELREKLRVKVTSQGKVSRHDYQGDIIAGRILKLIEEGYGFKDIAILLRSRTSLKSIENSLAAFHIPYCVLGGIGFWGSQEIIDIVSLYKLVFDSEDMVSLLTALRSPIFGFSDDMVFELMGIYRGNKAQGIVGALCNLSSKSSGEDRFIVDRSIGILKKAFILDGVKNAYEILKELCRETSCSEILLSLPNGQKKFRNLEKLFNIVLDFEKKGIFGAKELPAYLGLMEENSGMDSQAFLDTEDSDAVKILTIHASKGLEFKAVIIPDMSRALDGISKKNKPLFYYSLDDGILAIGVDDEGKWDKDINPLYCKIYDEMLLRENEESRRIFYVASTRAEKHLVFVGEEQELSEKDNAGYLNSFMKQLKWAVKEAGEITTIELVDGAGLIPKKASKGEYPPAFIDEGLKSLKEHGSGKESKHPMIIPVECRPLGNISITMYMKFLECQRQYYLHYISGLSPLKDRENDFTGADDNDEEDEDEAVYVDAALRGSIVHSILENMEQAKLLSGDIDLILDECRNFLSSEYMEACKVLYDDIRRYLKGYMDIESVQLKERRGRFVKSLHEFGFRVPLASGVTLNGVIDRVDIYDNGGTLEAYIVDYKTNRIREKDELKDQADYYKRQLCAYMLACQSLPYIGGFKPVVKQASLYFLDCGEHIDFTLSGEDMERLALEIGESSSLLFGKHCLEDYGKGDDAACLWCGYRRMCEVHR